MYMSFQDYLPFAHIVPNIQEGLQVSHIGEGKFVYTVTLNYLQMFLSV